MFIPRSAIKPIAIRALFFLAITTGWVFMLKNSSAAL
jgi:hypothetical protein